MFEHLANEQGERRSQFRGMANPSFLHDRVEDYFERRLNRECGGKHPLKGRSPTAGDVRMCTNDYLCLTNDQRIIQAEISALRDVGHGSMISRAWAHHWKDALHTFEERIAKLTGAEDALVCTSGYTANVGLIQSIANHDTPVYLDMKAHMSLWEGASSAKATAHAFRHNRPEHLENLVKRHGPGVIAVDALYSTDGAICRLNEITSIAKRYGCVLIVDETHSFGVQGQNGAGLVPTFGKIDDVHFRTVGLSKAMAGRGGVILCSGRNAEYLRYEAYPIIFSTTVLPHEAAGYLAALDIIENEHWRRDRLHENHAVLHRGLCELGYNVDNCHSQIISLEPGDIQLTIILRDALESAGVFGSVFVPPATTQQRCLLRFTVNCGLSDSDCEHVLRVCRNIRDEVRISDWRSTRRKKEKGSTTRSPVCVPAAA